MKILIFENEKTEIENAFKVFNIKYYENKIDIEYYANSQDFEDISNIDKYKLIILDIDLSIKSEKDGFGILNDIRKHNKELLSKVIVLTGSTQVRKKLDDNGFKFIPILQKPIDYKEIYQGTKDFYLKLIV